MGSAPSTSACCWRRCSRCCAAACTRRCTAAKRGPAYPQGANGGTGNRRKLFFKPEPPFADGGERPQNEQTARPSWPRRFCAGRTAAKRRKGCGCRSDRMFAPGRFAPAVRIIHGFSLWKVHFCVGSENRELFISFPSQSGKTDCFPMGYFQQYHLFDVGLGVLN